MPIKESEIWYEYGGRLVCGGCGATHVHSAFTDDRSSAAEVVRVIEGFRRHHRWCGVDPMDVIRGLYSWIPTGNGRGTDAYQAAKWMLERRGEQGGD